jgi:hypothetical protein
MPFIVGGRCYTIDITKGKLMYKDEDLDICPECNGLGLYAPDVFGKDDFVHKVPSTREGYYTFQKDCVIKS